MLHMPRALVAHQPLLALFQNLGHQRRDIGIVAEFRHRREERFEIEDDGAGEGQAPQGLPVDAEVDAREREAGRLASAVGFARVAGRHEEGGVDFETPRAALDGAGRGEFGEVAVVGVRGQSTSLGAMKREDSGLTNKETYRSMENSIFSL